MSRETCTTPGCERPRKLRDGRCQACYHRERRKDPAIAARDRLMSLAWKERNRERNRSADRERSRAKIACPGCGRMRRTLDTPCVTCRANQRRADMVEMYEAGVPLREMAEVLGTTVNSLSTQFDRLRKAGLIGYRYPGWEKRAQEADGTPRCSECRTTKLNSYNASGVCGACTVALSRRRVAEALASRQKEKTA